MPSIDHASSSNAVAVTVDIEHASEILKSQLAALQALSDEQLMKPRVTRERAQQLTATLLASFVDLVEPLLERELHPERVAERRAQATGLADRALAFYAADFSASDGVGRTQREYRKMLTRSVASYDRRLFIWALPLFSEDPELTETLRDIQRGRGYHDDAEDVLRLVALFREHWDVAEGNTPVTVEDLAQAEAAATEQLELLAQPERDVERDLAQRAYTAWCRDYETLQALGLYLARDREDVSQRFPAIRRERVASETSTDAAGA